MSARRRLLAALAFVGAAVLLTRVDADARDLPVKVACVVVCVGGAVRELTLAVRGR